MILLWVAAVAAGQASSEAAAPRPRVGTYCDLVSPKKDHDYLPNRQFLAVVEPGSTSRRVVHPETGIEKSFAPTGLTIYVRKTPTSFFRRRTRKPYKLRLVKPDPAGVLDSAVEDGRVRVSESINTGLKSYKIETKRDVPWWKRLL